jgi:pimeloyl-ACP methyl ester carboxylesterase
VRFDNRDVGLSTKIEAAGMPNIAALFMGDTSSAPYALDDMADDAVGLLDALGVESAHVAGVSMGGMIAQLAAIRHPTRVRSLASIMSSTGDRKVGRATPEASAALMLPPPLDRHAYVEQGVGVWRTIGSRGELFDEARVRRRLERSFDRAFYPLGAARQLAAILAARDRTRELGSVRAKTIAIHGADDPLIQRSGGEATARAIPDAHLEIIERMGHDLPEPLWPRIVSAIATNAGRC